MDILQNKLPPFWIKTNFDSICLYIQRGKSPKYAQVKNTFPVINQKSIRWNGIEEEHLKFIDESQWDKWEETRFICDGDILWNSTGTGTIGRACFIDKIQVKKAKVVDSHVTIVRPINLIDSKFVFYWVMHPSVQSAINDLYTGTTNQVELSKTMVQKMIIPLPTKNEQQIITKRLDNLLTQVDNLKTRLDTIPEILKQFRQSVLKSAVEGLLTESWRTNSFYVSKKALQIVAKFIDYRGKTPTKTLHGIPLITAKNIRKGFISREPAEFISPEEYPIWMTRGIPKIGDVLITTEAPMGNIALVDLNEKFALAQRAICLQFSSEINSKYAAIYMQSSEFQLALLQNSTGTTVKGIKAATLKKLQLRYPPIEEQTEIVHRVEELFAFADKIEQQVKLAQNKVNNLTQAILAKAFRGELTKDWRAQHPELISGEHSAQALLEKIQQAKSNLTNSKKSKVKK